MRGVPAFEFSFLRSFFNLISSIIQVKSYDEKFFSSVPKRLGMTLLMRCLVGTVGFAAFAIAMQYVPLSVFFVIFNSNPFTTALLSYFWLKEQLTFFEIGLMLCAFSGILMMSLSQPSKVPEEQALDSTPAQYQLGIAISLVACVGQSFICVASRRLWSIHFSVIQFNYALTSTICMGLCVFFGPKPLGHSYFVYDSYWTYLEIFIASFFNYVAQVLFTQTNQRGCPAIVGLIAYSGVLYNFLADVLIFGLQFTSLQLFGVMTAITFSFAAGIHKMTSNASQK